MNDEFWEIVCAMLGTWHLLAIVDIVIAILLVFSLLFSTPGSGAFVISVLGLVGAGLGLGLYAFVRRGCLARQDL